MVFELPGVYLNCAFGLLNIHLDVHYVNLRCAFGVLDMHLDVHYAHLDSRICTWMCTICIWTVGCALCAFELCIWTVRIALGYALCASDVCILTVRYAIEGKERFSFRNFFINQK